jgi:hypothetical protein
MASSTAGFRGARHEFAERVACQTDAMPEVLALCSLLQGRLAGFSQSAEVRPELYRKLALQHEQARPVSVSNGKSKPHYRLRYTTAEVHGEWLGPIPSGWRVDRNGQPMTGWYYLSRIALRMAAPCDARVHA